MDGPTILLGTITGILLIVTSTAPMVSCLHTITDSQVVITSGITTTHTITNTSTTVTTRATTTMAHEWPQAVRHASGEAGQQQARQAVPERLPKGLKPVRPETLMVSVKTHQFLTGHSHGPARAMLQAASNQMMNQQADHNVAVHPAARP